MFCCSSCAPPPAIDRMDDSDAATRGASAGTAAFTSRGDGSGRNDPSGVPEVAAAARAGASASAAPPGVAGGAVWPWSVWPWSDSGATATPPPMTELDTDAADGVRARTVPARRPCRTSTDKGRSSDAVGSIPATPASASAAASNSAACRREGRRVSVPCTPPPPSPPARAAAAAAATAPPPPPPLIVAAIVARVPAASASTTATSSKSNNRMEPRDTGRRPGAKGLAGGWRVDAAEAAAPTLVSASVSVLVLL